MSEKTIRAKYGGKLAKAINRAIRAEIPGGNEALDKLTQLAAATLQSGWKDNGGNRTKEATAYYRHKQNVVDAMELKVRNAWDIPAPSRSRK